MQATITYHLKGMERLTTTALFGSRRDIYNQCRLISKYFGADEIYLEYPDGMHSHYVKHGQRWYVQH